jgi:hypothetical protein
MGNSAFLRVRPSRGVSEKEGGMMFSVSESRVESWYGACTDEGEKRGFSFRLLVGNVLRKSFVFLFLLFVCWSMMDMQVSRSIV